MLLFKISLVLICYPNIVKMMKNHENVLFVRLYVFVLSLTLKSSCPAEL